MSEDALTLLSQILLDLYDTAAPAAGDAFRLWALERLQEWLPFSSAAWAYGAMTPKGIVLHHISLLGLPRGFDDAIRATSAADPTSAKLATASGKSFIHSRQDYPAEMLRLAADPSGIHSSVEGMIVDPATGLFGSVCLFRAGAMPVFAEPERVLHEALMPHWLKAPSRRLVAEASSAPEQEAGAALVAVADLNGVLEAASQPFIRLLQREWPDWTGGTLPEKMLPDHASKRRPGAVGRQISWTVTAIGGRLIIKVRPLHRTDKLGEREKQIAEMLGNGLTLKDVAEQLRLSPSTVRNHRDNIYHKLSVSNRLELLQLLRGPG